MKRIISFIGALILVMPVFSQIKEGKTYMIIASHSGKALEIKQSGDFSMDKLLLQQNDSTGKENQLFTLKKISGGYYQIIAKCSAKSLEVRNNSIIDHDSIQQNKFTGADSQLFTFIKNSNGTYSIVNKNSGYGFDVLGGVNSKGNNVAIIQYPVSGAPNQAFRLVEIDEK